MIWRSAMPLLTTLAALVIIVHCIEEDLETDYHHELRSRMLSRDTHDSDRAWRALEEIPVAEPTHAANWDDSSPERPKRRKPGPRKRKHRPQMNPEINDQSQELFGYPENLPRSYFEFELEDNRHTTEMPKRRRKKQEPRQIRWTDDDVATADVPIRKRGRGMRRRPSLESRPMRINKEKYEDIQTRYREDNIEDQVNTDIHEINLESIQRKNVPLQNSDTDLNSKPYIAEDKSSSEFSLEVTDHTKDGNKNIEKSSANQIYEKYQHKAPDALYSKPMDPLTLKDILRRSNGTSLSEILQQHNLSLTDLLSGREEAVSLFRMTDSLEEKTNIEQKENLPDKEPEPKPDIKVDSEEKTLIHSETKFFTEPTTDCPETTPEDLNNKKEINPVTTAKPVEESIPIKTVRRRYPTSLRKKMRQRPVSNTTRTYKGQLNRDIMASNARKYYRRNPTKSREWLNVIKTITNNTNKENDRKIIHETTTVVQETTIATETDNENKNDDVHYQVSKNGALDDINMDVTELPYKQVTELTINGDTTINTDLAIETDSSTETEPTIAIELLTETSTEKPIAMVVTMPRPTAISSGLRRQALHNKLKRKRLKHKNSTTVSPQDDLMHHLFGIGNLVSSSEFIARTQKPTKFSDDNTEEVTTLFDTTATEITMKIGSHRLKSKSAHNEPQSIIQITTPETAKKEIEEIFNDTETSEQLATILRERNMTIGELLEHRERGSSHVHLADIFHNTSREPNPAEPFLSKSLLEPISRETYPLRAILEANLHDPNGKVSTNDPNAVSSDMDIPVVMNFGNNVNENAENMGIMSLFNTITNNTKKAKDSEELYEEGIEITPNVTIPNLNQTRDTRVLNDDISWNELYSWVGNVTNDPETSQEYEDKVKIEDDEPGSKTIPLEDLENLLNFGVVLDSNEKLVMRGIGINERAENIGILNKLPSQTKSVTVATASIIGLAMILFLFTYAVFKWKQQRNIINNKNSFGDERIQTPVFANRKCTNSSSRSISPMLQTSNLYTLNTLGSKTGKESPEYMWDSLRKPFQ